MSIPQKFDDVGKKAKDLFGKIFFKGKAARSVNFNQTTKTKNGIKWKTTFDREDEGDVNGAVNATYSNKKFGKVELETGTKFDTKAEVTLDQLGTDKVVVTIKGDSIHSKKGSTGEHTTLAARYTQDKINARLGLTGLHNLTLPGVELDCTLGAQGVLAGVSVNTQLAAPLAPSKIDAKIQYAQKDLQFTLSSATNSKLQNSFFGSNYASFVYLGNKFQAGFQLDVNREETTVVDEKTKEETTTAAWAKKVSIGGQFDLDAESLIKAKLDTCGNLGVAYQQTLSNPNLKLGFGAGFALCSKNDKGECSFNKDFAKVTQFGINASFGDY